MISWILSLFGYRLVRSGEAANPEADNLKDTINWFCMVRGQPVMFADRVHPSYFSDPVSAVSDTKTTKLDTEPAPNEPDRPDRSAQTAPFPPTPIATKPIKPRHALAPNALDLRSWVEQELKQAEETDETHSPKFYSSALTSPIVTGPNAVTTPETAESPR